MRLPVYIAAASSEHARASALASRLQESGLVSIPLSWWTDAASWTGQDARYDATEATECVDRCDGAIAHCRLFWFLAGEHSRGAHSELGYARALRAHFGTPRIVVSGALWRESMFYRSERTSQTFADDDNALEYVLAYARQIAERAAALGSVT
jgi:hypothetical protein